MGTLLQKKSIVKISLLGVYNFFLSFLIFVDFFQNFFLQRSVSVNREGESPSSMESVNDILDDISSYTNMDTAIVAGLIAGGVTFLSVPILLFILGQ